MNESKTKDDFSVLIFQDSISRTKQVKQVLVIFSCILVLLIVNNYYYSPDYSAIELSVALFIVLALYLFVSSDTTNLVAGMLLWTMTILASFMAWQNQGLYDTSIVTFPCILIFAALLGGRLLILPLATYMIVVFYFFAYAHSIGFVEFNIASDQLLWVKANNLSIILIIYGLGIALVSSYVKRLIKQLYGAQQRNITIQQTADKLVLFDHLTQLPNEELCKKQIRKLIKDNKNQNNIIAFLTLDLDNFKWVNSSLGHKIGDKVLCYLAERLKKLTSQRCSLFHSAGKEFMFLIEAADYEEVSELTHQILQNIYRPFQVEDYDIEISSSAGIAISPFDGLTFEELRQRSHTALSRAKDEKENNTFKFFEVEMEEFVHRRLKMVQDLKHAIDSDEFELFYQPKINLSDGNTEGVEALIRWNKGGNEIVSPDEFIPVAEESGLINEIGKWVLQQACKDCQGWQQKYGIRLSVAVNLSPVQFRRGNLPNIIFRALRKSKLDPSYLELEITESLFIDDTDYIKEQVYQITTKGIGIAIDDFGTGYSNLNYLAKFNASTLKIDMSFVKQMLISEQQLHIVDAIINMSKSMDLKNVAEGVEDIETVNRLKQLGCQYGQGYYWSKPLPNSEFIKWISHSNSDKQNSIVN